MGGSYGESHGSDQTLFFITTGETLLVGALVVKIDCKKVHLSFIFSFMRLLINTPKERWKMEYNMNSFIMENIQIIITLGF